ncbi:MULTISPECIES: CoA ester lyase [Micromonospora]|uniref:HpcH/HpaI aldolase/citrate lyase family protein n=1 Tax=Micromonospora TaxID=1873 RepID=UPI001B370CBC|nr:CoA ester lyase [Micromonospora sp. C41]MBQ1059334.1 CoA ester lyase [Micromonospora sp. C41]
MAAVARSYLYVPGDRADLLDKAAGRGADALVLDLEDAVTPARKAHARETVAGYLGAAAPAGPELWVRINSDQVAADVEVLSPAAAGVWVPKAEPELLAEVDAALTRVQRRLGPDAPAFRVVALIETARGVLTAPRVAEAPRVLRLGLGEADLAGELGLQPGPERAEFAPIRSQVVVASAAAGITPPVGPVETTLRDPERLELTTRALLRQGFRARSAIHPGQIATINEVFTPTEAEVASARAVLAALERAERGGSGVATDADGRLLDRAVVRAAAEVVRRAEASTD